MRTSSGTRTINGIPRTYEISYPDAWCMAFNPNFIKLKVSSTPSVIVKVGDFPISVALYKNEATADISRLIQLCFTDIKKERYMKLTLAIEISQSTLFTTPLEAFWGCLDATDHFMGYGRFSYQGSTNYKAIHTRKVAWFKNFPFRINTFSPENAGITIEPMTAITALRYQFDGNTSVPGVEENAGSNAIEKVYFHETQKCFVGLSNGKYYKNWKFAATGYGSGEAYNQDFYATEAAPDTQARTDAEWLYSGKVWRYNENKAVLEEVEFASAGTDGLVDILPAVNYDGDSRKITYEIEWPNYATKYLQDLFKYTLLKSAIPDPFDESFDFTYHPDYVARFGLKQQIIVEVRDEKRGYYLRWIDKFGFLQYYLFEPGTDSRNITNSEFRVNPDTQNEELRFYGHNRPVKISSQREITMCAVNLSRDYMEYVMSIVDSPYVDLYVGAQATGNDLWVPVKLVDGSYEREAKPTLQDFEITIQIPPTITQIL